MQVKDKSMITCLIKSQISSTEKSRQTFFNHTDCTNNNRVCDSLLLQG